MSEYRYKKSSKVPIIIFIVAVVAVIAAVICVIVFSNGNSKPQQKTESTVQTTVASAQQTTAVNQQSDLTTEPQQQNTTEPQQSDNKKIEVPTISGEEQGDYFNTTLAPVRAVDTYTDSECTLKEVFGSSFSGGVFTFNSDGTFSESLSLTSANSGAYAVEGDKIIATYTNDKNIVITVTEWDGDTPAEVVINYGGYDVYFR